MIIKTPKKTILISLSCVLIIVLIIGIGMATYIHSLVDLIETGEVEGDPSFHESDLIETTSGEGNTTSTSPPGESTSHALPSETIVETTIDPRIIEAETQQQEALSIPLRSDKQVYNILLIGSDRREGETTGRSDSMIILSFNKRTQKIHLISLMRAMFVNIPDRGFGMLNAAYSYGGSKLLRQTMEDNLRVHIDDYVMIDFNGFIAAIDTIGGLDIELTEKEAAELNKVYGYALLPGNNHLDGTLSLGYARIRHIDSDFARTGRQRHVIELLIKKAMTLGPADLDALARAILPMVKTNMDDSEIINLSIGALDYKDYAISQLMLPIKKSYDMMYVRGMEVAKFEFRENIEALQEFLYDD